MADERTKPPYNQQSAVPAKYNWPTLLKKDGDELFDHYRHMLESLGNEKGLLGLIFNKSQNKFQDPSKLRRLVRNRACLSSSRSFSITHLLAVTIRI
jgi:type I restriction enzyme M protein